MREKKSRKSNFSINNYIWLSSIIKAIEEILPYYRKINRVISFQQDDEARSYLVKNADVASNMIVAEFGIGSGEMTRMILSKFKLPSIVVFDASRNIVKQTKENLSLFKVEVSSVIGVFEHLPFKNEVFDRIFASFALQDSLHKNFAVKEFYRVCKRGGKVLIANIGKPDSIIARFIMSFYMRFLMPLIVKILIFKRVSGNPWRKLIDVFENLPTNNSLRNMFVKVFKEVKVKEFAFGGIICLIAKKEK